MNNNTFHTNKYRDKLSRKLNLCHIFINEYLPFLKFYFWCIYWHIDTFIEPFIYFLIYL